MANILIEIGTEEIPASYLEPAIIDFAEKLENILKNNNIKFKEIKKYYTPRRLSLIIEETEEKGEPSEKRVYGPPEKIAIKEGEPTKALEGFVKRFNKSIEEVEFVDTEKGRYASLVIKEGGVSIENLLKENLENIVRSIKFPKTMVWEKDYRFARPVRWFIVMKDKETIDVELFGIRSLNKTYGHRFSDKPEITITEVKSYPQIMKENKIIVSPEHRKNIIEKEIKKTAAEIDGEVVPDEELLKEATNIVEYPVPVLCEYSKDFLQLPAEVLITALKYHQRAFSIKQKGKISPYFIVIGGNPELHKNSVKVWYERMVVSRLEDAKFFFEEDKKIKLDELVEKEKKVVWIKEVGSLFDKTSRLVSIVEKFAGALKLNTHKLKRAAYLSKADLLTNMVKEKEYTSLQGIMGSIYAKIQGEDEEVVAAIKEQYMPSGNLDNLPSTMYGSLLSIADRIDNIVAAFITGSQPTGSEDPHGIRRQGIGMVQIMINKKIDIDLVPFVSHTVTLFKQNKNEIIDNVLNFLKNRVYNYLTNKGYNYDEVRSITSLYGTNPYDSYLRVNSISKFREKEEFTDMVIGQKRVVNILRGVEVNKEIDKNLFIEEDEKVLFEETKKVDTEMENFIKNKEYTKIMEKLLYLRTFIDKFFDNVLVMSDDIRLRENRIALLSYVKNTFFKMADFSHIVLEQQN